MAWGAPGQPLLQSLQTQINAKLERLQLSSLPERLLVLSGDIQASLANLQLVVRGGLVVNRALIDLPSGSAPQLGSDVVVRPSQKHPRAVLAQTNPPPAATATPGPALDNDVVLKATAPTPATSAPGAAAVVSKPSAQPARASRAPAGQAAPAAPAPALGVQKANPAIVPDIDVRIDLGEDFRVRGMGLDTRLGGQLTVQNGTTLTALPRLTGTIYTDRGTFRAYGQDLQIERGRIRFTGGLDNPSLDVTAIRPSLDVTVGVQIRGTAQQPLVQLFSEPAMPDAERLSWLVLGRSSNGVADAALLQQAAVALLGGSGRGITGELADVLGLDQVGFQGGDSVSGSSISLGKRFSKNFYVAYEKGLDATVGSLSFFYDISRRLKLRGQTGQQSAVDLIYTVTYD